MAKYIEEHLPGNKQLEVDKLLLDIGSLNSHDEMRENVYNLLLEYIQEDKERNNMAYSITNQLSTLDYWDEGIAYFQKIRRIFAYIISINVKKAIKLQNNHDNVDSIKEQFQNIDWRKILEVQNNASKDKETGIIWVLNTAVTIMTEYKFFWNNFQRKDSFVKAGL